MEKLAKKLPPLAYLVAFEAAARYESFTSAADELCVTQAAISRQIRLLELDLGCHLFNRTHKAVKLTDAGRKFQRSVLAALDILVISTEDLRIKKSASSVRVSTDLAFASFWLIPKIHKFRIAYPDIAVHIDASDDNTYQVGEGSDVAIQFGDGQFPGYSTHFLLGEEVFPVCSPAYISSRCELSYPDDLLQANLIHFESRRWDWMDWSSWFSHSGVPLPAGRKDLYVNDYSSVIQAALGGQGIAIGWRYLVDDLLATGALVKAIDASVMTERGCYLLSAGDGSLSSEAKIFCDWIIGECK